MKYSELRAATLRSVFAGVYAVSWMEAGIVAWFMRVGRGLMYELPHTFLDPSMATPKAIHHIRNQERQRS